jgi:hypothetical protein
MPRVSALMIWRRNCTGTGASEPIGIVFNSDAAIEVLQGDTRGPRYSEIPETKNDG